MKGDVISLTPKKSFFRYLLSSIDDSNIISVVDDKTFKINKESKISVYQEILNDIDKVLLNHPQEEELQDQLDKLEKNIDKNSEDLNGWQQAINENLKNKIKLSVKLQGVEDLISQTKVHLQRFDTLNNIYISDIERLNFIEEAGYLALLKKQENCFSCGSLISDTSKQNNEINIKNDVIAAVAEIEKINIMQVDLNSSIEDLKIELKVNQESFRKIESEILEIDTAINNLKLSLDDKDKDFKKIINQRDIVNKALDAYAQKRLYSIKLTEAEAYKKTKQRC